MRLVYEKTGIEVKIGDKVKLSRGENVTVTRIVRPHKPESTGRVAVRYKSGHKQEYFPVVVSAHWIEREDQEDDATEANIQSAQNAGGQPDPEE